MYHQNYQNVHSAHSLHHAVQGGGYHYPGTSASAWEASYPGPTSGGAADYSYSYSGATLSSAHIGEQYPYYAGQYGQYSSMYHTMGGGAMHPSYTNYNSYYTAAAAASAPVGGPVGMSAQGTYASAGSLDSHPQHYPLAYPATTSGVDGDFDKNAAATENY